MAKRKTAERRQYDEMMSSVHGVSVLADMLAEQGDPYAGEVRVLANLAFVLRRAIELYKSRTVRTMTVGGTTDGTVIFVVGEGGRGQAWTALRSGGEVIGAVGARPECKEKTLVAKASQFQQAMALASRRQQLALRTWTDRQQRDDNLVIDAIRKSLTDYDRAMKRLAETNLAADTRRMGWA